MNDISTRSGVQPLNESFRESMKELAFLGAILLGYILILVSLNFSGSDAAPWRRLVLPNLWMLAMCILYSRRKAHFGDMFVRTGKYAVPIVVGGVFIFSLIAFALLWQSGADSFTFPDLPATLTLIILVPVCEELYFRGILLDHFERNFGRFPAVLLVSGLFGFIHLAQGIFWPMFILSLFLCLLVYAFRNILGAIALHSTWNCMSVDRLLVQGPWRWIITGIVILFVVLLMLRSIGKREESRAG